MVQRMDLTQASGLAQTAIAFMMLAALGAGLSCIDSLRKGRAVDPSAVSVLLLTLAGAGGALISDPWWAQVGTSLFALLSLIISLQIGMRRRKASRRNPPAITATARTDDG
jgi:hypothetical protein